MSPSICQEPASLPSLRVSVPQGTVSPARGSLTTKVGWAGMEPEAPQKTEAKSHHGKQPPYLQALPAQVPHRCRRGLHQHP